MHIFQYVSQRLRIISLKRWITNITLLGISNGIFMRCYRYCIHSKFLSYYNHNRKWLQLVLAKTLADSVDEGSWHHVWTGWSSHNPNDWCVQVTWYAHTGVRTLRAAQGLSQTQQVRQIDITSHDITLSHRHITAGVIAIHFLTWSDILHWLLFLSCECARMNSVMRVVEETTSFRLSQPLAQNYVWFLDLWAAKVGYISATLSR